MSTIWDFAKAMEEEGKAYYLSLAASASSAELAGVFRKIASEEEEHRRFFDALSKEQQAPAIDASGLLGAVTAAFRTIAASPADKTPPLAAADAYCKALEMEKKSVDYYQGALDKTHDAAAKTALQAIIKEETNHVRIVESLIEFVRRPAEWLENAEFTKLEEY